MIATVFCQGFARVEKCNKNLYIMHKMYGAALDKGVKRHILLLLNIG